MKDMFEKDHFRYLFLALVIVAVGLLVPQIQAQAQETYSELITCVSKNQKGEIIGTQSYELTGSSPIYCLSIRTVPEPDKVGVAYYLVSRSFFSGADNLLYIWQSDSGNLNSSYHNDGLHEDQALFYYREIGNGNYDWQKDVNKCITFSFDDVFISQATLLHLFKYFLDGDYTGADFSNWDNNPQYSENIGALAGLEIKRLFVPAKVDSSLITNPDLLPSEVAYQIEFDSRTTTGYLLKGINNDWIPPTATSEGNGSPQTVVRVWAKACYYLDKNDTLLWESADVGIGSYDPSDLSFRIEDKKIALALKEVANYPSDDGLTPLDVYRSDSLYFQIYDKYKGYGDVLRVRHFRLSPKNNQQADIIDDIGNIVTGSSVTIKDGTSSIGGDFDEALDHVDSGYSWVIDGNFDFDITDYFNNMGAFFDQIQIFPSIIAKILSFLPKWVLDMIALSIGSMCVILVIKAWRG